MICYIFDTGIILRTFLPSGLFPSDPISNEINEAELVSKRIRQHVFTHWVRNEASLIIPNFIVAETLRKFAQIFCFDEKLPINTRIHRYAEAKKIFIRWIKYRTIFGDHHSREEEVNRFINYELNRHHILNLDRIFEFDYRTSPIKKSLSAPDALLISVGVELQRIVGNKNVFILTKDKRVESVCMENQPKLPLAIYVADDRYSEEKLFPKIAQGSKIIFER